MPAGGAGQGQACISRFWPSSRCGTPPPWGSPRICPQQPPSAHLSRAPAPSLTQKLPKVRSRVRRQPQLRHLSHRQLQRRLVVAVHRGAQVTGGGGGGAVNGGAGGMGRRHCIAQACRPGCTECGTLPLHARQQVRRGQSVARPAPAAAPGNHDLGTLPLHRAQHILHAPAQGGGRGGGAHGGKQQQRGGAHRRPKALASTQAPAPLPAASAGAGLAARTWPADTQQAPTRHPAGTHKAPRGSQEAPSRHPGASLPSPLAALPTPHAS